MRKKVGLLSLNAHLIHNPTRLFARSSAGRDGLLALGIRPVSADLIRIIRIIRSSSNLHTDGRPRGFGLELPLWGNNGAMTTIEISSLMQPALEMHCSYLDQNLIEHVMQDLD
jgi:hypothetical protein